MANRLVEQSHLPVRRTLEKLGIPRATFHRWCEARRAGGPEALEDRPCRPSRVWSRIPEGVRDRIVELALDQPELSPRELAVRFTDEERCFVSEGEEDQGNGPVDRLPDERVSPAEGARPDRQPRLRGDQGGGRVPRQGEAEQKTVRGTVFPPNAPNQLWSERPHPRLCGGRLHLKVAGWGWYYLSTVLDDVSRFVVAWKLCATMRASDVTDTLDLALAASGLDQVTVLHRPRLLDPQRVVLHRRRPGRMARGPGHDPRPGRAPSPSDARHKIERWHQTLKNTILLDQYSLPGALEEQVGAFIEGTNHARPHESLANLTPADVRFGRGEAILTERARIKRQTLNAQRSQHHARAAQTSP